MLRSSLAFGASFEFIIEVENEIYDSSKILNYEIVVYFYAENVDKFKFWCLDVQKI